MINFSLKDFYKLCCDFVRYYPQDNLSCKRLQTFAVIEEYLDLSDVNLGKTVFDKNKPFFYSRAWEKSKYSNSSLTCDFPVFCIIDRSATIATPFSSTTHRVYSLELAFIDKYDRSCLDNVNCPECSKRTRNEIYLQTEDFMMHFFAYFRNLVVLTDDTVINKEVYLFNPSAYTIDDLKTAKFYRDHADNNKLLNFTRWDGGLPDLYGTIITINIKVSNCADYIWDANNKQFVKGYEGCC